jgi:DNA-binding MarR family transcriptional regulator
MPTVIAERTRAQAVQELFDGLLRFNRAIRARSVDWSHAARDLTRGDIVTLGLVERRGSARPGQIAAQLGVDPSVVSRQLATLHRLELVSRDTDPLDGRAELIDITTLGRDRLLESRAAMCAALASRLTEWDLDAVCDATDVIEQLADLLGDTPEPELDPNAIQRTKESNV